MTRWWAIWSAACILCVALTWELEGLDGTAEASKPNPPVAPVAAPTPAGLDIGMVRSAAAATTARPLFTRDRRPPTAREVQAAPAAVEQLPRLAGIVVGPDGRRAIFADGAGRMRAAAEGTRVGPFAIKSISPGQVTVTTREGEQLVRPSFASAPPGSGRPPSLPPPDGASQMTSPPASRP